MSIKPRASSVAYHVRVEPARHEIEVELRIEGPAAEGAIRVEVPTWVPGECAPTSSSTPGTCAGSGRRRGRGPQQVGRGRLSRPHEANQAPACHVL